MRWSVSRKLPGPLPLQGPAPLLPAPLGPSIRPFSCAVPSPALQQATFS